MPGNSPGLAGTPTPFLPGSPDNCLLVILIKPFPYTIDTNFPLA